MTVQTIADVVARMAAIQAGLPQADGVARFNHLYSEVTVAVSAADPSGGTQPAGFEDPGWLADLDVVFAGLYFAAVDGQPNRAWAPLFAGRTNPGIHPLQFALAGMNAHINHDLPLALVVTCEQRGIELESGSPQQRDYQRVNTILAAVEARIKAEYLSGPLAVADAAAGRLDDVLAMWSVDAARDAAWTMGEVFWRLRDEPLLSDPLEETLAGSVGMTSRGLLLPL
jgi:hypothetical protein